MKPYAASKSVQGIVIAFVFYALESLLDLSPDQSEMVGLGIAGALGWTGIGVRDALKSDLSGVVNTSSD